MTYLDIIAGMESIGLSCNYHKWSQAPALPYTLITHTESDDLVADNHNYFDISNYRLELYTALKDPPTERKVENWLKDQRIPYRKSSPGFIDSENMFLTAYDIRLIGG